MNITEGIRNFFSRLFAPKLCINCEYCDDTIKSHPKCRRPGEMSLVTGVTPRINSDCDYQRDADDKCGAGAAYFKRKT